MVYVRILTIVLFITNIDLCRTKIHYKYSPVDYKVIDLHSENEIQQKISLIRQEVKRTIVAHAHKRQRREATKAITHNCDSNKTDKPKICINLMPDKTHNQAVIAWIENHVILLLTRHRFYNGTVTSSTMWRSVDEGDTFSILSDKGIPANAIIDNFFVSPINKSKVILADHKNGYIYIIDGHDSITPVNVKEYNFEPDRFSFNPVLQDWILAYEYTDKKLHVSWDFGRRWALVREYVNPRFYWGIPDVDSDNKTVHMEMEDYVNADQFHYVRCVLGEPEADNTIHCKEQWIDGNLPAIDVLSLHVKDQYVFCQSYYSKDLYVSYKRGPFKKAHFPSDVTNKDYTVVNTDENQVFLGVYENFHIDLYLSDVTGLFYVLSMKSILSLPVKRLSGVDLHEVAGLKGVYIANEQQVVRGLITYITFDKGGQWSKLKPPSKDSNNIPTKCKLPDCSLHLHNELPTYREYKYVVQEVYSNKNAPGIIIAHGYLGKILSSNTTDVYMSVDGGQTWKELFKGPHQFTVLDQGGAIVAVSSYNTSNIMYSDNEGDTWFNHTFDNENIRVAAVINEPGISTLVASIYGHVVYKNKNMTTGWFVAKLDFSRLLKRKCTSKDYHYWSPSDSDGHSCILGQTLTYERRNKTAKCQMGRSYIRPTNSTLCQCRQEDFECDFGYIESKDDMCLKTKTFNPKIPVSACQKTSEKYTQNKGYRKVASDKCSGGDLDKKYQPTFIKCPVLKPGRLTIHLYAHGNALETKAKALFGLIQDEGTISGETSYTWDFGDKSKIVGPLKGSGLAFNQTHAYSKRGIFTVTVTASNKEGSAVTTLQVTVRDKITSLDVAIPYGAVVGTKATFTTTVIGRYAHSGGVGHVLYIWTFSDKLNENPDVTFDKSISHVFKEAKNYTIALEVVNPVSGLYRKITDFPVYAKSVTVQMGFSDNIKKYAPRGPSSRKNFAMVCKKFIVEKSGLDFSLLVVTIKTAPDVYLHVTILPHNQTDSRDMYPDDGAKKLIDLVARKQLSMTTAFFSDLSITINITSAHIVVDDTSNKSNKSGTSPAVYIAIPILFLAILLIVLITLYYRRKLRGGQQYNRVQEQDDNIDSLLDGADTDDEPPLDLNTEENQSPALVFK